jgi:DNA-binding transcriptional LysR family regulator
MRLEWLEDLLAILETGSLNKAAERRFITQPAFSRRVKVIEDYIGVELVDRTRKPAQLKKSAVDQQDRIRELVGGIHDLVYELKRRDREMHNRIVIAGQHAITSVVAPELVRRLTATMDLNVRLRSANRDECHGFLVTRQADIMLSYRTVDEAAPAEETYFEEVVIGRERLIPVFASDSLAALDESHERSDLPVVAYPADVFLGRVMNRDLLPQLQAATFLHKRAETALTLAALKLALSGIGVAWIPSELADDEIAKGRLTVLDERLPSCELSLVATRLSGTASSVKEAVWQNICARAP